jgi:bromodomain and WD repeat domain-containing protein 1/3
LKDKQISSRIATAAALNWKQQCKDLLDKLWQMEDSEPFREPVNILDVPDYLQVIDHPMDLQTVREQLQVNNYKTPMDFAKDVKLIFENSKNYNTNKRSRIYAMTVRLSCRFEEHVRSILASYKHVKSAANSMSCLFCIFASSLNSLSFSF